MLIRIFDMASFTECIAGLVKQGLTFNSVITSDGSYIIELTGGY